MANSTYPQDGQSPDDPLGIDTTQYTYSSFMYPLNLGAEDAGLDHYMVFHINESSNTQFQTRAVNAKSPTDVPTIVQTGTAGNPPGTTGTNTIGSTIKRIATTIVLYMPPSITADMSVDWEASELGVAKDVANLIQGTGSWSDVFKSAGISALSNAGNMVNEFTNLSLSDATSELTRLAVNNHISVIFKGIGFRKFQFEFKFTPSSEKEAAIVDNIVRAFKFYASPEIVKGSAGRFFIYPAEFDIQYFSHGSENLFLNKINTCALIDHAVNYTSAGEWSAFRTNQYIEGSPPVVTTLSLTFQELALITKDLVLKGY